MTVQTDFLKRCKALNLHDGKLSDWLDEIESLRQQLAAALAACELKDAAIKDLLEFATYSTCGKAHAVEAAKEALTIQPDDSALKEWLGDPTDWKFTTSSATYYADDKRDWLDGYGIESVTALYSPKGLVEK